MSIPAGAVMSTPAPPTPGPAAPDRADAPALSPAQLALAALWCAFPLLPRPAAIVAALVVVVLVRRRRAELRAALLVAVLVGLTAIPALADLWPLPLILALVLVLVPPPLRAPTPRGDLRAWPWIAALWLLVAVALPTWLLLVRPDLSDITARLPDVGWPATIALGIVFATTNAIAEELAWRHVLWEALATRGAPAAAIVGIQALSFGVAHIEGFPRGALGVALAAGYGLLLGILRLRAGGLLAPVLAHIGADAVIYALILATALGLLG
jgi:hypothetical protein